jgi:hypothetical protein
LSADEVSHGPFCFQVFRCVLRVLAAVASVVPRRRSRSLRAPDGSNPAKCSESAGVKAG